MTSKLKVNILADGGDNAIMTSDGSGTLTLNNASLKGTPAFLAYPSGGSSGGSISNLTETTVPLNTEVFDTDGKFDTSTYRFTPGIAGKYFIYASGRVQSDADFDPFQVSIYKNDSSELARNQDRHEHYTIGVTSVVADLNTTDFITLKMYQGSGGTLQISGFQNVTFMGGFRIVE